MGGTNQGFRPFYFLRPDSNCDARGPDYGTLGPAELNRWTGMWSELIRRPDVQNKAHRIVLGQDGYVRASWERVDFVSVCETRELEDGLQWWDSGEVV